MKSRAMSWLRLTRLALLGIVLLAVGATAQEQPGPADDVIAVSGHWSVTVVRHGEVLERRKFKNSLTGNGINHLSNVMARQFTPGPWVIRVNADGTGVLCADNESLPQAPDVGCTISQSAGEATSARDTNGRMVLEGIETVVRDANIIGVGTSQWFCTPATATADCEPGGSGLFTFTEKVLDTPISVQSGDQIEVNVTIGWGTLPST